MMAVDPAKSSIDLSGDPVCSGHVASPNTCAEPVLAVIGELHAFLLRLGRKKSDKFGLRYVGETRRTKKRLTTMTGPKTSSFHSTSSGSISSIIVGGRKAPLEKS